MKILVVEDEPTLNKIIAKRLKIEAYSVDCAFNGKEALEYLDAAEYDLLIVDIMMPEMDGPDPGEESPEPGQPGARAVFDGAGQHPGQGHRIGLRRR